MTEKEFRKLKRGDLLELLLAESRENTGLNNQLEQLTKEKKTLLKINAQLRQQLQDKDAELAKAFAGLQQKDADLAKALESMRQKDAELSSALTGIQRKDAALDSILAGMQEREAAFTALQKQTDELKADRELRMEKAADDVMNVTLKMREVFETAQKAAELYLTHIENLSASQNQTPE